MAFSFPSPFARKRVCAWPAEEAPAAQKPRPSAAEPSPRPPSPAAQPQLQGARPAKRIVSAQLPEAPSAPAPQPPLQLASPAPFRPIIIGGNKVGAREVERQPAEVVARRSPSVPAPFVPRPPPGQVETELYHRYYTAFMPWTALCKLWSPPVRSPRVDLTNVEFCVRMREDGGNVSFHRKLSIAGPREFARLFDRLLRMSALTDFRKGLPIAVDMGATYLLYDESNEYQSDSPIPKVDISSKVLARLFEVEVDITSYSHRTCECKDGYCSGCWYLLVAAAQVLELWARRYVRGYIEDAGLFSLSGKKGFHLSIPAASVCDLSSHSRPQASARNDLRTLLFCKYPGEGGVSHVARSIFMGIWSRGSSTGKRPVVGREAGEDDPEQSAAQEEERLKREKDELEELNVRRRIEDPFAEDLRELPPKTTLPNLWTLYPDVFEFVQSTLELLQRRFFIPFVLVREQALGSERNPGPLYREIAAAIASIAGQNHRVAKAGREALDALVRVTQTCASTDGSPPAFELVQPEDRVRAAWREFNDSMATASEMVREGAAVARSFARVGPAAVVFALWPRLDVQASHASHLMKIVRSTHPSGTIAITLPPAMELSLCTPVFAPSLLNFMQGAASGFMRDDEERIARAAKMLGVVAEDNFERAMRLDAWPGDSEPSEADRRRYRYGYRHSNELRGVVSRG
jgi:hypothetical protein